LLELLDGLDCSIGELDEAVKQAAEKDSVAQLLDRHPGVGPITALAFALTLGDIHRFAHSRQVVSYLGLNPSEHSSGGRQRMGSISKQGNAMVRSLLVEAGQSAAAPGRSSTNGLAILRAFCGYAELHKVGCSLDFRSFYMSSSGILPGDMGGLWGGAI
jgi:transposase